MTLYNRYRDLTEPFIVFGKTYPAIINELSIESLAVYADKCISSNSPMMQSLGKEVKVNISRANYNINGNI